MERKSNTSPLHRTSAGENNIKTSSCLQLLLTATLPKPIPLQSAAVAMW
jgi:hypothetical protein